MRALTAVTESGQRPASFPALRRANPRPWPSTTLQTWAAPMSACRRRRDSCTGCASDGVAPSVAVTQRHATRPRRARSQSEGVDHPPRGDGASPPTGHQWLVGGGRGGGRPHGSSGGGGVSGDGGSQPKARHWSWRGGGRYRPQHRGAEGALRRPRRRRSPCCMAAPSVGWAAAERGAARGRPGCAGARHFPVVAPVGQPVATRPAVPAAYRARQPPSGGGVVAATCGGQAVAMPRRSVQRSGGSSAHPVAGNVVGASEPRRPTDGSGGAGARVPRRRGRGDRHRERTQARGGTPVPCLDMHDAADFGMEHNCKELETNSVIERN